MRIAYRRFGSGAPVLLVGGLGMPGCMWLGMPGGLARRGYTVLVPDNRGTGDSGAPRPPYRMRDLVDDLQAVLDAEGVSRALVAGISFGGMLAQQLALRDPARVSGLVLAATSCGLPLGRLVPPSFFWMMARTLVGDPAVAQGWRELLVQRSTLQANPRIFERWDREAARQPTSWRGMLGQLTAAAGHSTWFALKRIRCPVEVIAGVADRIIPVQNARILARRIPAATLTLIPDAGHAFPLEHPGALPDAIDRVHARAAEGALAQGSSMR